jgi:hypothetical protein
MSLDGPEAFGSVFEMSPAGPEDSGWLQFLCSGITAASAPIVNGFVPRPERGKRLAHAQSSEWGRPGPVEESLGGEPPPFLAAGRKMIRTETEAEMRRLAGLVRGKRNCSHSRAPGQTVNCCTLTPFSPDPFLPDPRSDNRA